MDWLANKIEALRQVGFFEGETIQEITERIIIDSKSHYYGDILNLKANPDLMFVLSSYDKKNTWYIENESDQRENSWVIESGLDLAQEWTLEFSLDFYKIVFDRLANISKSVFKPKNLKVRRCGECAGISDRLKVNFEFNDHEHSLIFCIDHPRLILAFLVELNEIIAHTGYSFAHYIDRNSISIFIYFFNTEQKRIFDSLIDFTHSNEEDYAKYWLNKAEFYEQQSEKKLAFKCYEKAISDYEFSSYTISAISSFTFFLIDEGYYEQAESQYTKAIEVLKNKKVTSDLDEWWLNSFSNSLKELKNKR